MYFLESVSTDHYCTNTWKLRSLRNHSSLLLTNHYSSQTLLSTFVKLIFSTGKFPCSGMYNIKKNTWVTISTKKLNVQHRAGLYKWENIRQLPPPKSHLICFINIYRWSTLWANGSTDLLHQALTRKHNQPSRLLQAIRKIQENY